MSDPFAPDEMAQHRTMRHCPMCLQWKPCSCDIYLFRDAEAAASLPPEDLPADPELSDMVEELDQPIVLERWQERQDLE